MENPPALRLYRGHTTHQRSVPFVHRFQYGLALIDVDVDRLEEADKQSKLFSVDAVNLFSFRKEDHGERKRKDLRLWAMRHFEGADIEVDGPVRLVTFPRHVFYKFAPISLWLGYSARGELRGILYEVNNTFGESHIYVAGTPKPGCNRHTADKAFHVSPFFDVTGKYQFTLRVNENQLSLIIATFENGEQTHMATIKAKAKPATSATFAKLAVTKPVSSIAVTMAIHWQALKLWLKGAKYHSKPKQSQTRMTIAETKKAEPITAPIQETAA